MFLMKAKKNHLLKLAFADFKRKKANFKLSI